MDFSYTIKDLQYQILIELNPSLSVLSFGQNCVPSHNLDVVVFHVEASSK